MKRLILAIVIMFSLCLFTNAHAWTIDEEWDQAFGLTNVWISIDNDSDEDIYSFAVGMTANLSQDIWFEPYFNQIDNFYMHAVSNEMWNETLGYSPSFTRNYQDYFGLSWSEAFGNDYEWSFVVTGDAWSPESVIAAGTTFTSTKNNGFGYMYGDYEGPESPVIAKFVSGSLTGETGQNNQNPTSSVPEPATMVLLGTCLVGLGILKRKTKI